MRVPITIKAWSEIDHFQVRSEEWRYRRVQLGSMLRFFSFAQILIQECEKEFPHLSKNDDKPIKVASCAIASYGHMNSCLSFANKLSTHAGIKIKNFRIWAKDFREKRHRMAHPQSYPQNGKDIKTINVHECNFNELDCIRFPLWDQDIKRAEDRVTIILTPISDLKKLAELMELISENLLQKYKEELAALGNPKPL